MKKLLLSAILCASLNANVNEAVLGILGPSEYNTHKNLINHIFKNSNCTFITIFLNILKPSF